MTSQRPDITFTEFANACATDGHPLYKGFEGDAKRNFEELVFQALSIKVLPKQLYPRETLEAPDFSNVVMLPRATWHDYYAEVLSSILLKG